MKTLLEILKLSTDYLDQRGVRNARRQAEDLLSDALKIKRLQLYLEFERPLTDEELTRCREWLIRRGRGEPLQYIRGEVDFLDCQFKVTPAVLIPRQETEILADKISKQLSLEDQVGKTLWDVCCGSGCIGISLKKKFPDLNVTLSDLSHDAIAIAKENAELNKVETLILHGDLLAPFAGKQTDYFICNPPYIAEKELGQLDIEVREHEPHHALISGPTGLEFYERLAEKLPAFLKPGGKAWFEIGRNQGEAIKALFSGLPGIQCHVEQDWAGHDRFFFLENE
jgi:release factor glutamine methyltransferase